MSYEIDVSGVALIQECASVISSAQETLQAANSRNKNKLDYILRQYREKLKSTVQVYGRALDLSRELAINPVVFSADRELQQVLIVKQLQDRENVLMIIKQLEQSIDSLVLEADKLSRIIANIA